MALVEFWPNGSRPVAAVTPAGGQVDTDRLAAHILTCWEEAKAAKRPVELLMMDSLLARDNKYSEEKLRLLDPAKTSRVYMPVSSTKCRDAKAWILDIIKPSERAWDIEPTPVPDLPPDVKGRIMAEVVSLYSPMLQQEMQQYGDVSENTRQMVKDQAGRIKDAELARLRDEARKRCSAMSDLIQDQLVEGGFVKAFDDFIDDLVTLKAAILKGPVIRRKKRQKWTSSASGGFDISYEDTLVYEVDRVDPFRFYPGRDCEGVNDTFIIEHHRLSRMDLNDLLGVPGYSDARIRSVLNRYMDSGGDWLSVDNKATVDQAKRGYVQSTLSRSERIDALEFWGAVPGQYLIEWGLITEDNGAAIDPELQYEVNAWLIDRWVIKAIINPDKLRRKPYSVTSFIKIPGSIWGKAIPELCEGSQEAGNAIARGVVNNSAFASMPQVDVNVDKLEQSDNPNIVFPGKTWKSTGSQMQERAVQFYQPQLIAGALVSVLEFWLRRADADSGVPAYAHGDANVGGAGNTSSGLSMLIGMSSRGIMNVVRNVDTDVFSTLIERFYDMNMLYHPDISVKGDARVSAKGATGLMQKEQATMRLKEFAAQTNNPVDLGIMGVRGRAHLLRAVAKAMEIDVDKVLPDEQQLDQSAAQPQMVEQVGNTVQQPSEITATDNAGQPVAGTDYRLFNPEAQ